MQLKKSVSVCLVVCAGYLCISGRLSAYGYLAVDGGYRYDRVDESVQAFLPALTGFVEIDDFIYKHIESYVVGAKGLWDDPCTHVFVKGKAHYGWINDGSYRDLELDEAHLGGNSFDASGGVGYNFNFCNRFSLIPLVGFSYDFIRLQAINSPPTDIGFSVKTEKRKFSWYGPWVGFDLLLRSSLYSYDDLLFDIGYEFHYGWSRTKLSVDLDANENSPIWPYRTHFRDMLGQVFHVDGCFFLCPQWTLGLSLQYTYWYNTHKMRSNVPTVFAPAFGATTEGTSQYIPDFTWHSFMVMFSIGYCF